MAVQIQIRRAVSTDWSSINPILAEGELGVELDTSKFKIGLGTTAWNSLPYATGVQGLTGIQGTIGLQGIQGSQGTTGTQGITGTQGTQGLQGVQGVQGTQGTTGTQGALGIQGTLGIQGVQGTQGTTGIQGTTGTQGTLGIQGIQGIQGVQGTQGTTGTQGLEGTQGTQGIQGIEGNFGGATFDYTFSTNTADTDPGTGKLKFDDVDFTLAAHLYIDDQDDNATDIQSFLRTIDDSTSTIKGHFRISTRLDASDFALFTISNISEKTGYFDVICSYVSGSTTSFSNLQDIIITFARTGDKGDTGLQGIQGLEGTQGTFGVQGIQGIQGVQGTQGLEGTQGTFGVQGIQGVQGTQGTTGTQGLEGIQGAFGVQGTLGLQGIQGTTGTQGTAGVIGFDGSQGTQGIQGTEGIGISWTAKTANYTAVYADHIIADTTSGSWTLTLPASPVNGTFIRIADGNDWLLNPLTVARNGSTIEGNADNLILNIKGITVDFIYDGTTWEVFANTGPEGKEALWTTVTSSTQAYSRDRLLADASGGTFTITLPSAALGRVTGSFVRILDGGDWSTTGITIARNGATINGQAQDLYLDIGGIEVEFAYDGTTWNVYPSIGAADKIEAEQDLSSTELYPVMVSGVGTGNTAKINTTRLSFNSSTGALSATDFNSTSDFNLKENIHKLNEDINSIEILKQINPVSFNWKDSGKKSYGVIAQELEEILPELIGEMNGHKTVSYTPLIAFMIDAILELNKKIES
jgi:hypothetical protein